MNFNEECGAQVARLLGIPRAEVEGEQVWDLLMGSCEEGAHCVLWLRDATFPRDRVMVPKWESEGNRA